MKKIFIPVMLLAFFISAAQEPGQQAPEKKERVKAGYGEPVTLVQPQFQGGAEGLKKYLLENVKYPDQAKEKKVHGTVQVSFIVDRNGKITNEKIITPVDPDLDQEAIRVVHAMPDWKPGTAGGNPVDTQFILPVEFYLPESMH